MKPKTTTMKPCRRCRKPATECGYSPSRIKIHDWICADCAAARAKTVQRTTASRKAIAIIPGAVPTIFKPRLERIAKYAASISQSEKEAQKIMANLISLLAVPKRPIGDGRLLN